MPPLSPTLRIGFDRAQAATRAIGRRLVEPAPGPRCLPCAGLGVAILLAVAALGLSGCSVRTATEVCGPRMLVVGACLAQFTTRPPKPYAGNGTDVDGGWGPGR
ncbi:MAG: hypothetical protein AB7O45_18610 [Alphaproteobacteria bacterium]